METGKTTTPIKGSRSGEKCNGSECCRINRILEVKMEMKDNGLFAIVKGNINLVGGTYRNS